MKKATVKFHVPAFDKYMEPVGRLLPKPECVALFYYWTLAINAWQQEKQTLVLEGEPDIDPKYERLFRNSALMYGANIEEMHKYWPLIDAEIDRQNIERVMIEGKFAMSKLPQHLRFIAKPIEVKKKRVN